MKKSFWMSMQQIPIKIFVLKVSDVLMDSENLLPFLKKDERNKSKEFINLDLERNYVVHKAFERIILQHSLKKRTLNIKHGKYGKPFIDDPNTLFYNKSHSGDWVALAISTIDLGIDIEMITSNSNEDLVQMVYNEKDFNNFGATDDFFTVWSLKEAYSKLLGLGLNLNLNQLHIIPENGVFSIRKENVLLANGYQIGIDRDYKCHLVVGVDYNPSISIISSTQSLKIINEHLH
ncbi:4'-phosphopantetheinyl transferase superfamily protein [uncultured Cyclobacterium sp.]|uniref:4'-phosphopantetheinyl transferase family protein n=1 Tax=uncultured Cyclobacterium sp. TaxID=453820 RepID=UPI0030EE8EE5